MLLWRNCTRYISASLREWDVDSMNGTHLWKRPEAEKRIGEVLDCAKLGQPQYIDDNIGTFEVRFISAKSNEIAGDFLANGGPADDN